MLKISESQSAVTARDNAGVMFAASEAGTYFSTPENSRWLLDEFIPNLSPSMQSSMLTTLNSTFAIDANASQPSWLNELLHVTVAIANPVDRAAAIGPLLGHAQMHERFVQLGEVKSLRTFADESLPIASRIDFMEHASLNVDYLDWLVENKLEDSWQANTELSGNDNSRQRLMSALAARPAYARKMIEQEETVAWLKALMPDPRQGHILLRFLQQNRDLIASLINHRQLPELIEFSQSIMDVQTRSRVVAVALCSKESISLHLQMQKLDELFERVIDEKELVVQNAMLLELRESSVLEMILDAGREDAYVELLERIPTDNLPMIVRVILQPGMIEYLTANERLGVLLQVAERMGPPGASILGSHAVMQALIEAGYFSELVSMIQPDGELRAGIAELLKNSILLNEFARLDKTTELVQLVTSIADEVERSECLSYVLQSRDCATRLCQSRGTEAVITLVDLIDDEALRAHVRSGTLRVAADNCSFSREQLSRMIDDLATHPKTLRQDIDGLFSEPLVSQLIGNGLLDRLDELVDGVDALSLNDQPLLADEFYSSPAVLGELARQNQLDLFADYCESIQDGEHASHFLKQLSRQNGAFVFAGEGGCLPSMLRLMKTTHRYDGGRSLLAVAYRSEIVQYLANSEEGGPVWDLFNDGPLAGKLVEMTVDNLRSSGRLVAAIRNPVFFDAMLGHVANSDDAGTSRLAWTLLNNSTDCRILVENGRLDELLQIGQRYEQPEATWMMLLCDASGGVIDTLLRRGKLETAIDLRSRFDDPQDTPLYHIGMFRAAGVLEKEIAKRSEADVVKRSSADSTWLALACRGLGRYDDAIKYAQAANDRGMQYTFLLETGDWKNAAKLIREAPCPLTRIRQTVPNRKELEENSMLLHSRMMASETDGQELRQPLAEILLLANASSDEVFRDMCYEELMLSEQFEPAFAGYAQHDSKMLFHLQFWQKRYGEALRTIRWSDDLNETTQWLGLDRIGSTATTGSRSLDIPLAIDVLRLLNEVGYVANSERLNEIILNSVGSLEEFSERASLMNNYAKSLYQAGLHDLFWQTYESEPSQTKPRSRNFASHPSVFSNPVYLIADLQERRRSEQTLGLYVLTQNWQGRHPTDPGYVSDLSFRELEAILRTGECEKHQIYRWAEKLPPADSSNNFYTQPRIAVGLTYLRAGYVVEANRTLGELALTSVFAAEFLAQIAWDAGDWKTAAAHYRHVWELSSRADALYLSAMSLRHDSQDTASDERIADVQRGLYRAEEYWRVGKSLTERGELEEARKVLMQGLRITWPNELYHLRIIRALAEAATEPAERAKWYQLHRACHTRYRWEYGASDLLINVPLNIHDSLAQDAAKSGDWQTVDEQLEACLRISDGDVDRYGGWIQRFERADQNERVAKLKKRLVEAWQHRAAHFPESMEIARQLRQLQ